MKKSLYLLPFFLITILCFSCRSKVYNDSLKGNKLDIITIRPYAVGQIYLNKNKTDSIPMIIAYDDSLRIRKYMVNPKILSQIHKEFHSGDGYMTVMVIYDPKAPSFIPPMIIEIKNEIKPIKKTIKV